MREEKALSNPPEKCPACGYRNEDGEYRCEKCGRRLVAPKGSARAGSSHPQTHSTPRVVPGDSFRNPQRGAPPRRPAFPEPLRRELNTRVQQFRTRRRNPTLPFELRQELSLEPKVVPIRYPSRSPVHDRQGAGTRSRPRSASASSNFQEVLGFPSSAPQAEKSPNPRIAPFRLRAWGHVMDCGFILIATLLFLVPSKLLLGSVAVNRLWLAVGFGACLLLAFLYGIIFLYWAGATPGMKRLGLYLVNFDGLPASRAQRLHRLLGAIASAGSFFLGFLWAVVDEEGLSWHDRISKTFLAISPP